jgi:hypothetical protein
MVPDGTMLLGHARGELVLLVRRGDELLVPSARTTVLRSNRGSSSAIRFDAHGTMPASACAPARLSGAGAWSSILAYTKELGFPCSWCTQGAASQASNRQ